MASVVGSGHSYREPVKENVLVSGIPTVVSKLLPLNIYSDCAIVVIPGNPGLIEYYDDFISSLFEASGEKLPTYGISHAEEESKELAKTGHTPIDGLVIPETHKHKLSSSCYKQSKSTYTLQDQIDHKIAFLEEYLPPNLKLILIGHSIGAFVILQLLRNNEIKSRVLKAVLLFPTIERMAASPSGVFVTPFAKYFKWPAVLVVHLASFIPEGVKENLVKWWFADRKVHACAIKATLKLVNYRTCDNILTMTRNEMVEVDNLDEQTIRENLDKLVFYYGADDHWVPLEYYHDMKKKFPGGEIHLCRRDFKHAFVLESSHDVACMVWEWIRPLVFN